MKWFKKALMLSPFSPVVMPLVTISCAQNPPLNLENDLLVQTLTKINNWFNQYLVLALQYQLPTQSQFFLTYLPNSQLINGFTMTNLNWNYQNNDRLGQKTIQFDLVKSNRIVYQNQQITIKGFLNHDQAKLQTNQNQLDWTKQLINYQNQSANWITSGVGILNHPWLENFSLTNLIDQTQPDLNLVIERLITKQKFQINQVKQFYYQKIATNAILVNLSLIATNGQIGNPLKILITNLKPDPKPQATIDQQFNAWKQAVINNDLQIFNDQYYENLTISQFLKDLEKGTDFEDLFFLNQFTTPSNDRNRYQHQVRLGGLPKIIAIDWEHLSVELEGIIYYHLWLDGVSEQFDKRYFQPIKHRLFFRS